MTVSRPSASAMRMSNVLPPAPDENADADPIIVMSFDDRLASSTFFACFLARPTHFRNVRADAVWPCLLRRAQT